MLNVDILLDDGLGCCKNETRPAVLTEFACPPKDNTVHTSGSHYESVGTVACELMLSLAFSL